MDRSATYSFPSVAVRKAGDRSLGYATAAFCLLHIPLALLLVRFNTLSTLHAVAALGVGVWWAVTYPNRPEKVAYVGAYIMGAEVLWRMTNSQVFWEFGKYATAGIFLLAILRSGRLKGSPLMFGYFALLLPSIGVMVERLGPSGARDYISFNLSGPFAMMMAAWFFSQLKLSLDSIQRIFMAAVAPILGIASITFFGIYKAEIIDFTGESNFTTSGGFGPNQVAAALGLGTLLALMFILHGKMSRSLKLIMLAAMFWMAIQSALTFSRGGLYNFAGSVGLASIYLLRNRRTRSTLVFVAVMVFLLGSYVILPRLEAFTGGALLSRFSDTDPTNRIEIVRDQLHLWLAHPILGVGPGGSKFAGVQTAHTEFGRLPAEHGILGAGALLLLLIAAAQNIRKVKTVGGKAISVCLVAWSLLFMLNAGMRLVAPAFVFGMAFATILPEFVNEAAAIRKRLTRGQRFRPHRLKARPVFSGRKIEAHS